MEMSYYLNRGVKVYICHDCGFVEPYIHDGQLKACDCSKQITKKEFKEALEKAERKVKEKE